MTMSLTDPQAKLMRFLEAYISDHDGVAPSFSEMQDAIGLSGRSSVHRLLCRLEDRGRIRRIFGCARAIEIVQPSSLPNAFVDALRVMTADDLRICRQIIDERLAA